MTHTFRLARRSARLRAFVFAGLILSLGACDGADSITSDDPAEPQIGDEGPMIEPDTPLEEDPDQGAELANLTPTRSYRPFAGGIPFGVFHVPYEQLGDTYNGVLRCIYPRYLLATLRTVKARGGRVVISMGCNDDNYRDSRGNFSLSMWKKKIDAYRGIDFSSYVADGTVIGHYMIDEPHDPTNWNGKLVSQSTLDEMARYSKHYWPRMVTIARTWPEYLARWRGDYKYLDAAWAQYSRRKGNPSTFISNNVYHAKSKGLALIVGLNIIDGDDGDQMSASQVRSWGATLLSSSYPCAFLSWRYYTWYMRSSGIRYSMEYLRNLAENRSTKSCRVS